MGKNKKLFYWNGEASPTNKRVLGTIPLSIGNSESKQLPFKPYPATSDSSNR